MFEVLERKAGASPAQAARRDPAPLLLLVDDDPTVGRFLAHAAEECGYRAISTISPESFKRAYRTSKPDVVAIDLQIPGVDGIELLRFLAAETCEVPVVIISGFDRRVLDSSNRFGTALGLRMVGPLAKPLRFCELEALLGRLAGEDAR